MNNFKNEFSWSKSRDGIFKECLRKYFFNHYGFWNGWNANEEDRVKKIYYLKKLSTKEIWMGSLVHEIIEYILRKYRMGENVSLGHVLTILRKRFDLGFRMSELREYTGFNSSAHRFFEHEYKIGISEEERKELLERAEFCLTNFFNSDVFMDIRRTPVENWMMLEDFLSFDFEGTKIFLSIDFAMKIGEGVILYDWKTGKERMADFDLQLSLYAFYIADKFKISPDKIEAKIFNLAINKVDVFNIDKEKLEKMRLHIEKSIRGMKKLLKDVVENEAVENDFEKNRGFWCQRCNFRKVCLEGWGD